MCEQRGWGKKKTGDGRHAWSTCASRTKCSHITHKAPHASPTLPHHNYYVATSSPKQAPGPGRASPLPIISARSHC